MEIDRDTHRDAPQDAARDTPQDAPRDTPHGAPPGARAARRRRAASPRRVLLASVAGAVVLAGVVTVVPRLAEDGAPPALGPVGRAQAAYGAGVPAALPDLAALIGDREAHLRRHPADEESWAVLGSAYVEQARRTADLAYLAKADAALKRSLARRSGAQGNVEALAGMAVLANARHDYRAAKKHGEAALAKAPQRWTLYPLLIEAYGGLGDDKAVGKALEKLQELRSGSAVMARTAQVYRDRGWREDAAAYLSDAAALAETPAEQAAYQHRFGELLFERGEPAQALNYFEAALRTEPEHHAALAGKGRAQAALGRNSEAMASYQAAITKLPRPEYALELGELYESLGMTPAAQAQYELLRARVREESTVGVNAQLILGRFEADHGDPAAAVRRLTAEFRRRPGREVSDALGWALHRAGQSEKALPYATRAMKDGPMSALFAYHRGEIEREIGKYGPARRHLQQAMRINPHFSPLLVPYAQEALDALGEPPEGGPANMDGTPTPPPSPPRPAAPARPNSPAARPSSKPTATPTAKPSPKPTATPSPSATPTPAPSTSPPKSPAPSKISPSGA
ncbi:tetratricopeptide repeat protein [Streptomyces cavernicola]|uniref:Tetratricopeptide repeat protein n=1 Tax=Streptomyces cavernicola TaxID=3043613 RepID=A0ABT6SIJ9_9ACTN|nr:tetratricopeptide repeat protein [Streptomyces sp. B-S-A6]MDI3407995.1 tetratricopeptide repeat protein [Streptomyces sp. B-S-A6]